MFGLPSGIGLDKNSTLGNGASTYFSGVGPGYITLGEPPDLTIALTASELTIVAWVKPAVLALNAIVSKSRPGVPNNDFLVGLNTDGTVYGYFGGVNSTSTSASIIVPGNWYQIGYTVKMTSGVFSGSLAVNRS